MEPSEFYFFILPLGALIVILVSLVLYLARKQEIKHDEELETLKTLSEMLQSGILDKRNFVSVLHGLLHDKIIDQDEYERLGKMLETHFKEQSDT